MNVTLDVHCTTAHRATSLPLLRHPQLLIDAPSWDVLMLKRGMITADGAWSDFMLRSKEKA
jgi:hypothetical protein